jgi:hypothetical protein
MVFRRGKPRFVLQVGFLIAVAAIAAALHLGAPVIVGVMAAAFALVVASELVLARTSRPVEAGAETRRRQERPTAPAPARAPAVASPAVERGSPSLLRPPGGRALRGGQSEPSRPPLAEPPAEPRRPAPPAPPPARVEPPKPPAPPARVEPKPPPPKPIPAPAAAAPAAPPQAPPAPPLVEKPAPPKQPEQPRAEPKPPPPPPSPPARVERPKPAPLVVPPAPLPPPVQAPPPPPAPSPSPPAPVAPPSSPPPAPAAPPPPPTPVAPIAPPLERRRWNIFELQHRARARAGSDPERDEELSFLLVYLREFADVSGDLPEDFDSFVRESFHDLIAL